MRKRVDNLGVSEPEIQRSGSDQIDVSLPDVKNADEARQQVGTTAQLLFYDWEANVVGPDCKPNPADPNVTGGASAGARDARAPAVRRGHPRGDEVQADEHRQGAHRRPSTTSSTSKAKKVLAGPDESRADLQREAENKRVRFDPAGVVAVPQGFVGRPRRAERPQGPAEPTLLRPQATSPSSTATEIKNPEQNFDNGPGESGQPNVTFDFTGQGAGIWQKFTRELAQRGQAQLAAAPAPTRPTSTSRSSSTTSSSRCRRSTCRRTPTASTASGGSHISGGFTIRVAQTLANLLKTGALPIKLELDLRLAGLGHAGQAGAQPGPHRGHRGLRRRRALPADLLPRARRDRRRRAASSTRSTSSR